MPAWPHPGVGGLHGVLALLPSAQITPVALARLVQSFPKIEDFETTLATNFYAPLRLCQALVPLMRKRGYGRVVNLSSGMGQLDEMSDGWAAYRVSKTALNALTRMVADATRGEGILVNSVCPGWVRTDMGGSSATRGVEKGAQTAVWLASLPDDGPTGGFFRDRQPIPW